MASSDAKFPSSRDYWFAFYCVLCFALMVTSFNFPALHRNFQMFIVEVATPVINGLSKPRQWLNQAGAHIDDYIFVVDENRELKSALSDQRQLQKQVSVLQAENMQMRQLLDMSRDVAGESLGVRVKMDTLSPFTRSDRKSVV